MHNIHYLKLGEGASIIYRVKCDDKFEPFIYPPDARGE